MTRRTRIVKTFVILTVALTAFNAVFVWFPRTDRPTVAGVVVVVGGANDELRLDRGIELVQQGFAPSILTDTLAATRKHCHLAVSTQCIHPEPFTTQGEARAVEAMAKAKGWKNVLLIISDDQATRARIRFRRCYQGGLTIVTVSTGGLQAHIYHTLYEDAALIKAETLQRGC